MRNLANKKEMKIHKIRELEKRFLNFNNFNDFKKEGCFTSSWCNKKIVNPDNQRFFVHITKIKDGMIYPDGYELLYVSTDDDSSSGTYKLTTPKPIFVTKSFALKEQEAIYKDDLLFIYEDVPKCNFLWLFNRQQCAIPYQEFKDLSAFVDWYRNESNGSYRCIPYGKLSAAYNTYQANRKTALFDIGEFNEVYKKTDTYINVENLHNLENLSSSYYCST